MNDANTQAFMCEYLAGLKAVLDSFVLNDVESIIDALDDAYRHGHQIFVAGNGGSAATASHLVCDLGKTVLGRRNSLSTRRFKVISLVDNGPLMTAWANDMSYEVVFAEQLCSLANRGDLLVVITASGSSPNIVAAVKAATDLGLTRVGLLGFDGGVVRDLLDHCVIAYSDNYGYIEDAHISLLHLITAYLGNRYRVA